LCLWLLKILCTMKSYSMWIFTTGLLHIAQGPQGSRSTICVNFSFHFSGQTAWVQFLGCTVVICLVLEEPVLNFSRWAVPLYIIAAAWVICLSCILACIWQLLFQQFWLVSVGFNMYFP
jgi:hypothetical protein